MEKLVGKVLPKKKKLYKRKKITLNEIYSFPTLLQLYTLSSASAVDFIEYRLLK